MLKTASEGKLDKKKKKLTEKNKTGKYCLAQKTEHSFGLK